MVRCRMGKSVSVTIISSATWAQSRFRHPQFQVLSVVCKPVIAVTDHPTCHSTEQAGCACMPAAC